MLEDEAVGFYLLDQRVLNADDHFVVIQTPGVLGDNCLLDE